MLEELMWLRKKCFHQWRHGEDGNVNRTRKNEDYVAHCDEDRKEKEDGDQAMSGWRAFGARMR